LDYHVSPFLLAAFCFLLSSFCLLFDLQQKNIKRKSKEVVRVKGRCLMSNNRKYLKKEQSRKQKAKSRTNYKLNSPKKGAGSG